MLSWKLIWHFTKFTHTKRKEGRPGNLLNVFNIPGPVPHTHMPVTGTQILKGSLMETLNHIFKLYLINPIIHLYLYVWTHSVYIPKATSNILCSMSWIVWLQKYVHYSGILYIIYVNQEKIISTPLKIHSALLHSFLGSTKHAG